MELKPLGDKIVVRPLEKEAATASGLVIPGEATEMPVQGTVIAIGPGKKKPLTVRIGDEVLFSKNTGIEITIQGEKGPENLIVMREDDVFSIINK